MKKVELLAEHYKVIKEYPNYYLCESRQGYKECFDKSYKPVDGVITIQTRQTIETDPINKDLEEFKKLIKRLNG